MNRSELRTLAANFCEDPNQTKFSASRYNDALEKAQQQFCLDSKVLYKNESFVMAENDQTYDLPTDFIQEKIVMLNGLELMPISRDKLGSLYRTARWDTVKGQPVNYIIDPMDANKQIILVPIPDSGAISQGTDLNMTYYCVPTTMSSDSSTPFNGAGIMTQFHIAVAHYAAWLLLGYLIPSDAIISKRADMINAYVSKVNEAIQTFGDTKTESLSIHPQDIRVR